MGLTPPAVGAFLRLTTKAVVLDPPLRPDQAIGHLREWLARPHVLSPAAGPDHLSAVLELLEQAGTARCLTTDAQIAAYAREHRGTVYSNDADFHRFEGVEIINPLRS